ncbi:carboxymuconolactone decarboxylase family protein [Actinoplanes sp. NPDC020271]|uniref:carboxymuconolactone decarboxylase family protein n=1 Tax=Actinoplanes sp. NPDC020271 TaxID=3363896 RepID=UPI00379A7238
MDITSRLPDPTQFFPELGGWAAALTKALNNGTVPATTIALVHLRVGQIVGSTYHTVRQSGILRKAGQSEERITAVASWRDAPYFDASERVALELAEAVCTPNPTGERVTDDLYRRAAEHYDEPALWTLTLVIAQILFFVPVAAIAKPIPGTPFGKNYRP